MDIPYDQAVANLRAASVPGDDYNMALDSLNNHYGMSGNGSTPGQPAQSPPPGQPTTPLNTPTPSLGTYKGVNITPGDDASVMAQEQAIDARQAPPAITASPSASAPFANVPNGGYIQFQGDYNANGTSFGEGEYGVKNADGSISVPPMTNDLLSSLSSGKIPVTQFNPAAQIPPSITDPSNPLSPPNTNGSFNSPPGSGPSSADTYNTSLAQTLQAQQQQLVASLQQQQQNYQNQIDALNAQNTEYQNQQQLGLTNEQSLISQETQQKQAALEQEQQQFQDNYNARQGLVGQLQTLLGTGQQIIEGMKATTGLSSIMNPRITQTMASVQGQAGVITAALAAYDTQIGLAQNQLKSATDAITNLYGDQVSYWQNVINFYDNQIKTNDVKVSQLTSDQRTYVDAQIKAAQDAITNTQNNANLVLKAMLDPTTALAYGKAGISLTDSPAQIAQKLAMYETASNGVWSAPQLMGNNYVQINRQTGEVRSVASKPQSATDQAESSQIQQRLVNARGNDGYTDPNLYARLRASSVLTPTAFDGKFAYLINPQSYAHLGISPAQAGTSKVSAEQLKQFINQQISSSAFQGASSQQQQDYIRSLGGNPADYGY